MSAWPSGSVREQFSSQVKPCDKLTNSPGTLPMNSMVSVYFVPEVPALPPCAPPVPLAPALPPLPPPPPCAELPPPLAPLLPPLPLPPFPPAEEPAPASASPIRGSSLPALELQASPTNRPTANHAASTARRILAIIGER